VLRAESVDLDAAIAEDEPMLARLVGGSVRLVREAGPGAKWVRVDRGQLLQILLNLTINARDAMPSGGDVTIRTSIRSIAPDAAATEVIGEPGLYAELSVTDTGEGITEDDLAHVFEPFFTTKEVGRGTGLGLATVHGVVAQSQGHVWAESRRGVGTTLTLLLPITDEAPRPARAADSDVEVAPQAVTVLVVEDEPAVRSFLAVALADAGFHVVEAENGRDALSHFESGTIALVVSDVVMPVMSGPELERELRRRGIDVPIVFLSGYTREAAFEHSTEGRTPTFLQKPVPAARLVSAVHRALSPGGEGALGSSATTPRAP
jgi:two-component system, cell cycle sensor histidine kinase and response regulator CckA